ncbi:radical SAM/SPASM domain-containing protein [Planctomycetota bacterium]
MADQAFPKRVSIENTNACNARCTICPREKLTRPIQTMDMDTFQKLLDDCVRAGASKLSLHNFGEPLMDTGLAEKVAYAKKKGVAETFIVTNASLLTPERSRELLDAGIDRIKISFYGVNAEEYEKIHVGLKYDATLDNVRALLDAKKEHGGKKPRITLRYIGKPLSFLRFAKQWLPYRRLCSVVPGKLHNYTIGRDFNPVGGIKRPDALKSCRYLKRSVLYILVSGDVVPCCYDFNAGLVMGNALQKDISDIWNGERFTTFRQAHGEHRFDAYPICAGCDKLNYIFI